MLKGGMLMVFWITSVCLLTFFALLSLFIPRKWNVSCRSQLNSSCKELYAFLTNLKNWPAWQMDEEGDIAFLYVGPKIGEGAAQYWVSDDIPSCLRIERCELYKRIHCQIRINQGETVLHWTLEFNENKNGTEIAWMCQGTSKRNPFDRYLTLFYKWMLKREMKEALGRLKRVELMAVRKSA
jgi:hypothetical protein